MDELVKQLEEIRQRKGLSIERFAQVELGLASTTYWRWVQGQRTPGRMARRIIDLYLAKIGDEERAKEGAQ